ncbi:ATP-binding protein [Streptomyces virginiae]|uniref:ATP-binding protein n=1 Tax=Streptomyces virginiae TaxID=1961 RepID=UPI0037195AB0
MDTDLGYEELGAGRGFAMVGRNRELDLLSAGLLRLPAVIFVEGEAGVGKSRLVQEASRVAAEQGTHVLTGYCHPLREPLPFGPVLEALSPAAQWLPEPARLNPQTGALASLLPSLAAHLPPAPQVPADPRSTRFQILGAVRAILDAIAPAVLVVEDLHWADETTRELLLLLAHDLPKGLGLVLTYRREDLPPTTPVLGAPYRRPAGASGAEIHLEALSEQDVQELVADVLGPRATRALAHTVYERSAGLPVIAEEDLLTLTDWGRHNAPDLHGPATDGVAVLESARVPRALWEAVVGRMAGMSASAVAVARAAAVLSVPSSRAVLAEVAGLESEVATGALMETLQAAVLREGGPALYGFRHVLAQQAVYDNILGPLREELHRRAHQVLSALEAPPLVQIAHHTYSLGDTQRWLREAEAAADQAIARGDDGTAITLIHNILKQPLLTTDLRTRAALALARIAHYSVDYAASAAALRRIVADPELSREARGEIRLALGLFMINQQADKAGNRELERSVQELETRPDLAVRAMVALARAEPDLTREEAMAWMDRAERTVAEAPTPRAQAAVRATRLDLMALDGDPSAWEQVEQLPLDTADREELRQYLRGLNNLGVAAMERGYDERAARLLNECGDRSRQSGFRTMESYSRVGLLILRWLDGRWAGLEERFAALSADAPDMLYITRTAAQISGNLAASRGQWVRALKEFRQAAVVEDRFAEAGEVLSASAGIAQVRLAQGDPEGAWTTLTQALDPLPTAPRPWANGLLLVGVQAALACGREEAARHLFESVEQGIRGKDDPAVAAVLRLAQGMLLQHDGDPAAVGHFEHAHLLYQAIDRPYPAAQAMEQLGRARITAAPEDAARQLAETADAYTGLGATADAARCQQALRELGLARPTPRGRRSYGTSLSPRENQVAHLLADGATNKDIALALSLSPRTVEHHVARTLKKIGVTRDALRGADIAPSAEQP